VHIVGHANNSTAFPYCPQSACEALTPVWRSAASTSCDASGNSTWVKVPAGLVYCRLLICSGFVGFKAHHLRMMALPSSGTVTCCIAAAPAALAATAFGSAAAAALATAAAAAAGQNDGAALNATTTCCIPSPPPPPPHTHTQMCPSTLAVTSMQHAFAQSHDGLCI